MAEHGRDSYTVLYSVIKGVSVGVAILALKTLMVRPDHARILVPLFVASFLGVVLTYTGTAVGSNLLPARLSVMDVPLPLTLAVAEASPFVVLSMRGRDPLFVAEGWMLSMAVFNFTACLLLVWVRWRLRRSEHFDPDTHCVVIDPYRRRLLVDARSAGGIGICLILTYVLLEAHRIELDVLAPLVGVATIAAFLGALYHQEESARELRAHVRDALHSEPNVPNHS